LAFPSGGAAASLGAARPPAEALDDTDAATSGIVVSAQPAGGFESLLVSEWCPEDGGTVAPAGECAVRGAVVVCLGVDVRLFELEVEVLVFGLAEEGLFTASGRRWAWPPSDV